MATVAKTPPPKQLNHCMHLGLPEVRAIISVRALTGSKVRCPVPQFSVGLLWAPGGSPSMLPSTDGRGM